MRIELLRIRPRLLNSTLGYDLYKKFVCTVFVQTREYLSQNRNKTSILNYWTQFDKAVV